MDAFIIEEIDNFSKFIQLKKEVPTKSILLLLSKDNRAKTSQNILKDFININNSNSILIEDKNRRTNNMRNSLPNHISFCLKLFIFFYFLIDA